MITDPGQMGNLLQQTQPALHPFVLHPPDGGAWAAIPRQEGAQGAWERGGGMLSGTLGGGYTPGHGNKCLPH